MRLRVIDRILIALSGLILLALAAAAVLETAKVLPGVAETLQTLSQWRYWNLSVYAVCALLALLGIYEVSVLFRRRKGKRGFISQKSENGEIAISVKTIESLVTKCAKKHGEIEVHSVAVEEQRSGLLIKLRTSMPSGMNIPLAVGTLQKQLKQYITACSGVDVSEVQVKVESTDKSADGSPYAIADDGSALPVVEPEPTPVPVEAVTPVEVPAELPEEEAPADERELLTHQRLFAPMEEPAMVPEPPVPEEPILPSEEEIEAEVSAAMADATDAEFALEDEDPAEDEAHWVDVADQMEEQAAAWEAITAEAEKLEAEWDAASQAEESADQEKAAEDNEAEDADEPDEEETTTKE